MSHLKEQQARLLFLVKKLHQRNERKLIETAEKLQPAIKRARHFRSQNRPAFAQDVLGHLPAQGQFMVDDADRIAKTNAAAINLHPVDVTAMRAGQVDQHDIGARKFQHGMLAADLVVIQHNVVGVQPPDIQDRIGGDFVNHLVINHQVSR